MKRYYFDLRDQKGHAIDTEGLEFPDLESVAREASRVVAEVASQDLQWPVGTSQSSIEVRDDAGPLMLIRFTLETRQLRTN